MSFNNVNEITFDKAWKGYEKYESKDQDQNIEFEIEVQKDENSNPRKLTLKEVLKVKSKDLNKFKESFVAGYKEGFKEKDNDNPPVYYVESGENYDHFVAYILGYKKCLNSYRSEKDDEKNIEVDIVNGSEEENKQHNKIKVNLTQKYDEKNIESDGENEGESEESDGENESEEENKQPRDENLSEDSQDIIIKERKKDTDTNEEKKEKQKIDSKYNTLKNDIQQKLDQVKGGVKGSDRFFQLINEITPIYVDNDLSKRVSKRFSKSMATLPKKITSSKEKKKITLRDWSSMIENDSKLKEAFVLGVEKGQYDAKDDLKQLSQHNAQPSYRPRSTTPNWPCSTNTKQALKNFAYCAGYALGYYTTDYDKKLQIKQQRTKWRNTKRKEQFPCCNFINNVTAFIPRGTSFNQLGLGIKFLMQFITDNVTVYRIGDIIVATTLAGNIFIGMEQSIEEIVKLICRKKHHDNIKKYNESFNESLSWRDTGFSKDIRSMLGILNSGGKILLNGLALGFYMYTVFNPSNNLFASISLTTIIGANFFEDIGNGIENTVDICIDNKKNEKSKQIAPIQHCCTFAIKPWVNGIADIGSIALMWLNYCNIVSDDITAVGIAMLQIIKTSFNYLPDMLAKRAKRRNDRNEICKIKIDKNRESVDFLKVKKLFETNIGKDREKKKSGKIFIINEKTPLLGKSSINV